MDWTAKNAKQRDDLRLLNKAIPETAKGFAALSKGVKEGGVLEFKHKEYVALGIAVAQCCEPCIGFHVEALMKAGATREEMGDVVAMAVQMGGGPALMYAAKAFACWDELAAAQS
ncbi:MAG: carboxymuconolactone decarboxylase family protein [Rhodobacterales bacterium]|nr:carboxymuconolactone decarboxylase family protein [Rhodobacterales bacterium]MDX5499359.1 carboxymuconolactone decarboxylase family protein [Rhodobacterales bacterium]